MALAPGYLGVRVAQTAGNITHPLDRLERIVWSLFGTGLSISVVYIAYVALLRIQSGAVQFPAVRPTVRNIALAFPVLVLASTLIGVIAGRTIRSRGLLQLTRDYTRPTWNYIVTSADEPIEVRVVTKSGTEIWGQVGIAGSTNDMRDLLLMYPQRIVRKDGQIVDRVNDGESVYVREDSISELYFETDIELKQEDD